MQFKKWQVKCLILFIYCHCASAVCFMTLWITLVLVQRGEKKLPTHRPVICNARPRFRKKALKAYLPLVLKSAGTNKWDPPHNPVCSGFYHLLAWTHCLPATKVPHLLLGKEPCSTGTYGELQRQNRAEPAPS